MSIITSIESDIAQKVVKRLIISGVNAGAAWLVGFLSQKVGVHVSQVEITGAAFAGLEALKHYLILKYPAWSSLLS